MDEHPVVIFDGVCNYCNHWVDFAIRHDRKKILRFSASQSPAAQKLLAENDIAPLKEHSVVLIDKGRVYHRSSAVLRICRYLDGGWKAFRILLIIPRFIRDFFYSIVARNRYRWFGQRAECRIPEPGVKERFLD